MAIPLRLNLLIHLFVINFACRCILVDETDRVVGHDSKYNCKCTWLESRQLVFSIEIHVLILPFSYDLSH